MGFHAHLMPHIVTNLGATPFRCESVCVVGRWLVRTTAVATPPVIGTGHPAKSALLQLSGTCASASIGSQDERALTQEIRKLRKTENSRLYALRDEFSPAQRCVL